MFTYVFVYVPPSLCFCLITMEIEDFFPDGFVYKVLSNKIIDAENFTGEYRVSLKTVADFRKWLRAFEEKTNTAWILKNNLPARGRCNYVVNRTYVCHHTSLRKRKRVGTIFFSFLFLFNAEADVPQKLRFQ